jgi:hypothetical protein
MGLNIVQRHNAEMPNRHPRLELIIGDRRDRRSASTSASPEEAAAIVAALERFTHDTAAPAGGGGEIPDPWTRAAMLEGVMREEHGDVPHPWINP